LVFLALVLAAALLILLQLNGAAQMLGVASLVPVVLYPLAKRVTDWPQAVLGVIFSWAAPMGYVAVMGGLDGAAFALWAAGFFWILGYDTIYAHQDREDDALVGIRSSALRLGDKTRPFLILCYGLTMGLLALAGWLAGLAPWYLLGLAVPGAMLARQVVALDIADPALCLRLFKANRDVGLAIAAAFLLGRL
jgi:4-hydroxybenzoate polyprenyltransferase